MRAAEARGAHRKMQERTRSEFQDGRPLQLALDEIQAATSKFPISFRMQVRTGSRKSKEESSGDAQRARRGLSPGAAISPNRGYEAGPRNLTVSISPAQGSGARWRCKLRDSTGAAKLSEGGQELYSQEAFCASNLHSFGREGWIRSAGSALTIAGFVACSLDPDLGS